MDSFHLQLSIIFLITLAVTLLIYMIRQQTGLSTHDALWMIINTPGSVAFSAFALVAIAIIIPLLYLSLGILIAFILFVAVLMIAVIVISSPFILVKKWNINYSDRRDGFTPLEEFFTDKNIINIFVKNQQKKNCQ